MKKFLLNAPSNLVLLKKGLRFQILLLAMLFCLSTSETVTAQCIGPYQGFESIDATGNPPAGWSFNPGTSMTTGVSYGVGTFRTGQNGIDGGGGVPGDYLETATIATPLTFSCYLASEQFDLLISDGINGWESLLDPTIRGYYGVTAASANVIAGGVGGAGFPFFDLASVTFAGVATNGRSNSNVKFRIVDADATSFAGIYMDDFAWTSRTASDNTIVVPQLGTTTSCTPITVPAAGTGFLTFYDQGGSSDDYNQGQTQTMTFAPAIGTEKVQITFETPFALTGGAVGVRSDITVYNGPTTGSPVLLNAWTSTSTIPTPSIYASSDASGNITIRFVSRTGTPLSGFKIKVECVGCPAPTALAFAASGGFSNTQAFLTWSGSAANYEVYYSTSNTAPTGATLPNGGTVATTSATVSGLSASTLYYFWVRSNCGAGSLSSWTGPISATTLCNPQTVTYLENFNGLIGGALPNCTSATNSSWVSNNTNGNLFCNGVGQSFLLKELH